MITAVAAFIWACSSNDDIVQMMDDDVSVSDDVDSTDDDSNSETLELKEIDVAIILPEESNLDLSTTEIVSFLQSYGVDSNGQVTILGNAKDETFVSLQNKEGNVLLYGFIDDTNNILSIASSAKASLYFSLGTFAQFDGIKDKFFNEYEVNSEVEELQNIMEARFLENPYFMEEDGFAELVKATVDKLVNDKEIIDISKGVIVDSQEKSGVKVINSGQDAISFQSRSRRRAHAFVYKTAYKPKGENQSFIDLLTDISGNENSYEDREINRTDGFTSVIGTGFDVFVGKGQQLFIKDTPPLRLPLTGNEQAAKFSVRVIGPHCTFSDLNQLTQAEFEKLEEIYIDTFAFDIILPTISTVVGFKKLDENKISLNVLRDAVVAAMGSSSLELLFDGKFSEAFFNFAGQFNTGGTNNFLEAFIKGLLKGTLDAKNIDKLIGPLKIADALLVANDAIGRISLASCLANPLEEWEVIISETNDLTCLTDKSVINPAEITTVKAVVQDLELRENQNVLYIWETSGPYGKFTGDGVSFDGQTAATLNDNVINFLATVNESELVLGDVEQEIHVKAILKEGTQESVLGECTSTIKITPNKWKIRPDGLTISGGNNLVLRIVDEQNKPVTAPEGMSMDVEWNSTKKHGQIDRYNNFSGTTEVTYECLDSETENGIEIISAKVYLVGGDGFDRVLAHELEATINIENDENKLIYTVNSDIQDYINPPTAESPFYNYGVYAYWEFDPKKAEADLPVGKEVERYHLQIIEPFNCAISKTWYPENQENDLTSDGTYQLICGSASTGGHEDTWDADAVEEDLQGFIANALANKGYGRVTVYLRNKQ